MSPAVCFFLRCGTKNHLSGGHTAVIHFAGSPPGFGIGRNNAAEAANSGVYCDNRGSFADCTRRETAVGPADRRETAVGPADLGQCFQIWRAETDIRAENAGDCLSSCGNYAIMKPETKSDAILQNPQQAFASEQSFSCVSVRFAAVLP